ncbi:hypothetical protein ABMA27_007847 [Loxostege sticticalis]|uniref:Glucuronosyltransferase n=1 Tax=Loxostege sticticalis TaxID=481309 RepID=A0ABR3HD32_LOXSC
MLARALVLCCAVCASAALRVLLVFPLPGASHAILAEGFVTHLIRAGHQVTIITPIPSKNPSPNLRQVDVSANFQVSPLADVIQLEKIMTKEIDLTDLDFVKSMMNQIANATLSNPNVKRLMEDPRERFDVVIAEWLYTELYAGFASVFDCPLIWSSSMDPHAMVLWLIDEAPNPAYVADHLSDVHPPFDFWQRAKELWTVLRWMKLEWSARSVEDAIYNAGYGPAAAKRGLALAPLSVVKYNASLMLGNSHVSIGQPMRLPGNYKQILGYHVADKVQPLPVVREWFKLKGCQKRRGPRPSGRGHVQRLPDAGQLARVHRTGPVRLPGNYKQLLGYHVADKVQPLPENLQKIMDEAKHGVIYFSMGSMLKSKTFPDVLKKELLQMFSGLKQTVLWKFEETPRKLPKNVHVVKWAPQQDILAHPNCVLFITHGGLLSLTETIHFGVPIIGIPMYGDQFLNTNRAVRKGFGKKVDLDWDFAKNLKAAIEEILGNPSYKEKVKEVPHLRSPALHVPFYQKMYVDLAAVVVLAFLAVVKTINFALKFWNRGGVKEKQR